jgi:hypothetical protein
MPKCNVVPKIEIVKSSKFEFEKPADWENFQSDHRVISAPISLVPQFFSYS